MHNDHRLVAGRYRLGRRLGHGAMGEVRLGLDVQLGRAVAVKLLRSELAGNTAARARFRHEAQAAARLNHPTIVRVFDTGEDVDPATGISAPYIVMELVEGDTLRSQLRAGLQMSLARALAVSVSLLDAVAHSHAAGIIHQDIKPGNVMLTTAGGVKVVDFGIARAVSDGAFSPGSIHGTAKYLSPEQARGEGSDARSDLYATGCVMYELLAGRPPFLGESFREIADQHVNAAPLPVSELSSTAGPEVDAVVLKALSKDPVERYQSADDMRAAVIRLQEATSKAAVKPVAVTGASASALPAGGALTGASAFVPGRAASRANAHAVAGPYRSAAPRRARRRPRAMAAGVAALLVPVTAIGGYSLLNPGSAAGEAGAPSTLIAADQSVPRAASTPSATGTSSGPASTKASRQAAQRTPAASVRQAAPDVTVGSASSTADLRSADREASVTSRDQARSAAAPSQTYRTLAPQPSIVRSQVPVLPRQTASSSAAPRPVVASPSRARPTRSVAPVPTPTVPSTSPTKTVRPSPKPDTPVVVVDEDSAERDSAERDRRSDNRRWRDRDSGRSKSDQDVTVDEGSSRERRSEQRSRASWRVQVEVSQAKQDAERSRAKKVRERQQRERRAWEHQHDSDDSSDNDD